MTEQKLIPVQLPLDPAKATKYFARNGVRVKSIISNNDDKYPFMVSLENGFLYYLQINGNAWSTQDSSIDITHELEEEDAMTDWTEVVERIYTAACNNFNEGGLQVSFKSDVTDILSQTHNLAPQTHKLGIIMKGVRMINKNTTQVEYAAHFNAPKHDHLTKSEPASSPDDLEFIPGELYEDREGGVYEFLRQAPNQKLIFMDTLYGSIIKSNPDGTYNNTPSKRDIVRKYMPQPKKHKVTGWVNVYMNDDGTTRFGYHVSGEQEEAKKWFDDKIIACLRIEREFTEGEGL